MKKLSMFIVCGLVMTLAGCKATHDSLMKDMISKMKEMVSVMKGVTDESSAKSAGPKLKSIQEDIDKLSKEGDALPKLSGTEQEALLKKYEGELQSVMSDVMKESMRLGMDPKLSKALGEGGGLKGMGKGLPF